MVSQNELDRQIRYVKNRVECVERNNHQYSTEELKDELEGLDVVKKKINEFINQNQDLSVDQLSELKDSKHLLYDCIEKLKAKSSDEHLIQFASDSKMIASMGSLKVDASNRPTLPQNGPQSSRMSQNKPNRSKQNSSNRQSFKRDGRPTLNVNNQGQRNGPNHQTSSQPPLAFGGADCSTMIRFFRKTIDSDISSQVNSMSIDDL